MAVSNIPDYKLDGTFLKEFMIEMVEKFSTQVSSIRLPVFVQVIKVFPIRLGGNEWSQLFLSDGQFEMSGCAFLSKQARPEIFSILKITKIIKLPENLKNNLNDSFSLYRVGEIEFDVEVSSEQIGFCLYKNLKDMNMRDLMKRKREFGWSKTKEALETPYSAYSTTEIMTHMWENRSELFCDINFTFEEDEGVVVFAHRSVLVAASEVFRAHSDNTGFIDNKTVHIVDSSFYSFSKLLEFIYTGNVQFTTWKLAFELLYLSKKYLMSSLENLCQNVITDYCDYDSENLLKVFEENNKVNDEKIQSSVKNYVLGKPYEVIHSVSFLNCAFSTVEWIFSLNLQIDEWSRLCAIYKWAHQNRANAFCQTIGDESDVDCLHALLEDVRYENIDGLSLQRFLNLPKLPEIVDSSEIKQSIFDRLLENVSYLDTGTKYPKCRRSFYASSVYAEIEIGSSREREMKDIQLTAGPLLGFKIKVEKKKLANGKLSLDIVPSFRYLYSKEDPTDEEADLNFRITAIKTKSRISKSDQDITSVRESVTLKRGEWQEFRLQFEDCEGYIFERIEDFGIANSGGVNKSVDVISLEIDIDIDLKWYVEDEDGLVEVDDGLLEIGSP